MMSPQLRKLDFELAYLSLLTQAGIKPLSRWEKSLASRRLQILKEIGLKTAIVQREVTSGLRIEEVIFSTFDNPIDTYLRHFENTPVNRSPHAQRIEGILFGYPSCCVDHFIKKGYAINSLSPEDQKILFHWACPGCEVTPHLLPRYREVYERCCSLFDLKNVSQDDSEHRSSFRQGVAVAASLALLASGSGVLVPKAAAQDAGHKKVTPVSLVSQVLLDSHLIPLVPEIDADQDYLTDDEELHVGTYPDSSDTDGDGVLDGVQLAKELWAMVEVLPTEASETEPYRVDHETWGGETCEKCGKWVDMGFVEVINSVLGLSVPIPYIGLHFMKYGGFSYIGTEHTGRVSVSLLNTILKSERDPHWLALEGDSDSDGLADEDEAYFGTDMSDPDTDDDGVLDGVELAIDMWRSIEELPRDTSDTGPFAIEMEMDGLEMCQSCGQTVNMGFVLITHPLEGLSATIPFIGLHYMEHGSFVYDGDYHGQGTVNPRFVNCILKSKGMMHLLPVKGDSDNDGLSDEEEILFGTNPFNSDSDADGVFDGVNLAKTMRLHISELDTSASETDPYIINHKMRGVVMCPICGTEENMGYIEIVNIPRDLHVQVPYLGLHFMERGSFAYGYDPGDRVDPIQTAHALNIHVKGDINRDGSIGVTDVIALVNFILGLTEPTPDQIWAADLNGDGELNILDVVLLVRAILD